jgi:hypothetical protein
VVSWQLGAVGERSAAATAGDDGELRPGRLEVAAAAR